MTPTQRTFNLFRDRGYRVERVERWIQAGPGGYRKDLMGFIDFLAFQTNQPIVAIQSCGGSWSAHLKTIESVRPSLDLWLSTGSQFTLVGWRRLKAGWRPRIMEITNPLPLGSTVFDLVEVKKLAVIDGTVELGFSVIGETPRRTTAARRRRRVEG